MAQERKLATMLFADIVGSTGYTGAREPEVVRSELGQAFDRVRTILVDHGGTVEKFIGDAVMCVFGVPVAHEDDAERALRAAVAMRTEFERSASPIALRIGVNTGEVVSGDAAAGEPLVTGQAVIGAARLQENAAPGEILAGPLTRRIAGDAALFGDVRTIKAKGMDILASTVLGLVTSTPGTERRGLRAPLIGREEELVILRSVLRRTASERRGHIVTVFGEAGVGKTRLVTEFLAGFEGAVLRGRCLPYGRSITFWPLREMLERAAGIELADDRVAANAKLRRLVDSTPGPPEADRDELTRALAAAIGLLETDGGSYPTLDEIVSAIRRFLEQRAQHDPLVIVIEDIHWAETAFLDLIEQLSSRVHAALLIICVARPELFDRRPAWGAGRTNATALTLQPLTRDETLDLARQLLRLAGLSEDLAPGIVTRTEGNPLYVEETVRTLTEGDDPRKVPATLQGIVTARLDRLPHPIRIMLRLASVQGRDFSTETLDTLGDPSAGRAERIDLAIDRDFIVERGEHGPAGGRAYRFRHVIIRDVIYGTIAKTDRWRAHLDLSRSLQDRATPGTDAAYHLEQAFQLASDVNAPQAKEIGRSAFAALHAAAAQSRDRQDFATALDLYERALRIGERVDIARGELLEVEASSAIQRLRLDPTVDTIAKFDQTLASVREAGPSGILVRLLTWRIAIATPRSLADMRAYLAELVKVARATGNVEYIAQALWLSHEPDWLAGDLDADRRLLEEGLEYAKANGATFAHISSLCDLAANALERGEFTRALGYLGDAEGPSHLRGAALDRFKVLAALCEATLETGDLGRGGELARDARHLARSIGGPWAAVRSATLLADALRSSGDGAGGRALLAEELHALEETRASGAQDTTPNLLWRIVRAAVEAGDLDAAERALGELRKQPTSDVRLRARSRALEAMLAAARGAAGDGARGLRDALEILAPTGCAALRTEIQVELARLLRAEGERAERDALVGRVLEFYADPAATSRRDAIRRLL